jgi:iron complex outermembrane recepter protein
MPRFSIRAFALVAAAACAAPIAHAQAGRAPSDTSAGSSAAPEVVTIQGRTGAASAAGFGDVPVSAAPFSLQRYAAAQWAERGIHSVGDLSRLDAGIGDAYNAPGYFAGLSVRGFALDPRLNLQRDGLRIHGETALMLDNKAALEVLKGSSGLQAGVSAPGGLVNLLVKRSLSQPLREASWQQRGAGTLLAVDWNERFASDGALGLRLNAAAESLRPQVRGSNGQRQLLALATEWRVSPTRLLEAEWEHSRQSQASVVGFSLLGDALPSAKDLDLRVNLNHQPWGLPVVFAARTGSVRWTERGVFQGDLVVHAQSQRLRTDDRTAFPYGCSSEARFDRYCSDGSFDLYEYRSEGERRFIDVLDVQWRGRIAGLGAEHHVTLGLQRQHSRSRLQDQVFDFAGVGHIDGSIVLPPSSGFTDANTNRDERSSEAYLRVRSEIGERWQLWTGVRAVELERRSRRSSGDPQAIDVRQRLFTPWLAVQRRLGQQGQLYASWGEGIESEVVPNRARFLNAGQALPALKSRQLEAGWKWRRNGIGASIAAFDIRRPMLADSSACSHANPCILATDGDARHRGAEAQLQWEQGPWSWQASAMALKASREGSRDTAVNGLRPSNVPAHSLRLGARTRLGGAWHWQASAHLSHEGRRAATADGRVELPAWTQVDLGLSAQPRPGLRLDAAVDNLSNRRAWKEAPTQFGHLYLYPLPSRSWRVNAQFSF